MQAEISRIGVFDSGIGDNATLLEFLLAQLSTGFFHRFAARDFHFEFTLEPENDVEKVNRLGVEIADQ